MAWSAQPGGGGDQRPGRGEGSQVLHFQERSAGVRLDAELIGAVVHDGLVGRAGGTGWAGPGVRRGGVAEPAGLVGRAAVEAKAPGRRCRRGLRRARVMASPMARRPPGAAPGERAVVAMVASRAQAIFRSGLPLSSSRSRWVTFADITSRRRGRSPRSAWTGRGRTAAPGWRPGRSPSAAARSSWPRTDTLTSSRHAEESFHRRPRQPGPTAGVIGLVALRGPPGAAPAASSAAARGP